MFETFNVPGLYIAVQAVLAIAASWTSPVSSNRDLSGLVVDSGDGLTHIIPVVDGHVIGSGIRQIPLAGRDVTNYILRQIRERKEPIPPEESLEAARIIKEHHCYVCPNATKEVEKYESNPEKYTRQYHGIDTQTGQKWTCNVTKERFMSAEILFSPLVSVLIFNRSNTNVHALELSRWLNTAIPTTQCVSFTKCLMYWKFGFIECKLQATNVVAPGNRQCYPKLSCRCKENTIW